MYLTLVVIIDLLGNNYLINSVSGKLLRWICVCKEICVKRSRNLLKATVRHDSLLFVLTRPTRIHHLETGEKFRTSHREASPTDSRS